MNLDRSSVSTCFSEQNIQNIISEMERRQRNQRIMRGVQKYKSFHDKEMRRYSAADKQYCFLLSMSPQMYSQVSQVYAAMYAQTQPTQAIHSNTHPVASYSHENLQQLERTQPSRLPYQVSSSQINSPIIRIQTLDQELDQTFKIGKNQKYMTILKRGKFNHIYSYKFNNEESIVKVFNQKYKQDQQLNFKRQITIHAALDHECIVKCLKVTEQEDETWLFQEKGLTDFFQFVQTKKVKATTFLLKKGVFKIRTLPADLIKDVILDICQAIHYLHRKNIIHRDLKPQNIIVFQEHQRIRYKVTDFGLAVQVTNNQDRTTFCGSNFYLAPEIYNKQPYNEKVDIWAIGVMTYEFFTGEHPFEQELKKEKMDFKKGICYPAHIPFYAIQLIQGCLKFSPFQRSSSAQLLSNKFLDSDTHKSAFHRKQPSVTSVLMRK